MIEAATPSANDNSAKSQRKTGACRVETNPKSWLAIELITNSTPTDSPNPRATPSALPINPITAASPRNIRRTFFRSTPMARITPISFQR